MKRGGYLKRRRGLRRVSDKRRVLLSERAAMLSALGEAHLASVCAGHPLVPSIRCGGRLDPHEPLTRARGGSIVGPANVVFICRRHHSWAHRHQPEAHALGLLVHSWDAP